MNYAGTWFYADPEGQESNYYQSRGLSSSKEFQDVYWRCVMVFYKTLSKNWRPGQSMLFFTNVKDLNFEVDGVNIQEYFDALNVHVLYVENKYPLPKDFYHSWQNQFYIFSIIDSLQTDFKFYSNDQFLIMDCDCVVVEPLSLIYDALLYNEILSYTIDYEPTADINGLTREDMREIHEKTLNIKPGILPLPRYHAGDIVAISYKVLFKLRQEWEKLYKVLLLSHDLGEKHFNEEAHCLSFLYDAKFIVGRSLNPFFKRCWTTPTFNNLNGSEKDLHILHCPAEKQTGFQNLFNRMIVSGEQLTEEEILKELNIIQK